MEEKKFDRICKQLGKNLRKAGATKEEIDIILSDSTGSIVQLLHAAGKDTLQVCGEIRRKLMERGMVWSDLEA